MSAIKRNPARILWFLSTISILLLYDISFFERLKTLILIECSSPNSTVEYNEYIVPNVLHFIRFDKPEFTFNDAVCMLSAYKNQKPDKIIIHTNVKRFTGKYWDMVKNIPVLRTRFFAKPNHIFGKELRHVYHSSDVARIEILLQDGGIYLDNDVYVVQSLDRFRKFEMSFGRSDQKMHNYSLLYSMQSPSIGNMVLIAKKKSRFLKMWYESYKVYDRQKWYYNAGDVPFKIYTDCPHLAHLEPFKFGAHLLYDQLYLMYWPEWKNYYTIHMLSRFKMMSFFRDFITEYDEENIKESVTTYGEMARLVIYNTSDII